MTLADRAARLVYSGGQRIHHLDESPAVLARIDARRLPARGDAW